MKNLLPTCSKVLGGYDSCGKRWYLSLVIATVAISHFSQKVGFENDQYNSHIVAQADSARWN
jgi:hypothetical protein